MEKDLIFTNKKCKFCNHIGCWYECLPQNMYPNPTLWFKGCMFCHNREEISKEVAENIWTIGMSRQWHEIESKWC